MLSITAPSWAFHVPPIAGHVTDTAGRLSEDDERFLDDRLEKNRVDTGYEIAAFVTGSLEGEPVSDVAYQTFQTWKLGQAGKDNGVLLVVAPNERQVFIATGKGVEGALTDLESSDILTTKVFPALKQDRFRDAIANGTDAIAAALVHDDPGRPVGGGDTGAGPWTSEKTFFLVAFVVVVGLLLVRAFRNDLRGGGGGRGDGGFGGGLGGGFGGGGFGGGGFGGGGFGGGGGGFGGDGGGGGGGFSGGGGSTGGGGAGGSY